MRGQSRGGLASTQTPTETARKFADRYGSKADAVVRDRISKAGTEANETYWRAVEAELKSIPPSSDIKLGRCASCNTGNVMLPAVLTAEPSKAVCARCHADPSIATMPREAIADAPLLCPNCGSGLHRRCCARCGRRHPSQRMAMEFCSAKCEKMQHLADERSADMERDEQADRADRKELDALRDALREAIAWIEDRSSGESLIVERLRGVLDGRRDPG